MFALGWFVLLVVLLSNVGMRTMRLGLWSGLALCAFVFLRCARPTPPPTDLLIVQGSWLLFGAALDAAGLFHALGQGLMRCVQKSGRHAHWVAPTAGYFCAWLTGNAEPFAALHPTLEAWAQNRHRNPRALLASVSLALRVAVWTSPCSLSGLLLLLRATQLGLPFLPILGWATLATMGIALGGTLCVHRWPEAPPIALLLQWMRPTDVERAAANAAAPPSRRSCLACVLPLTVGAVVACIQSGNQMDAALRTAFFASDFCLPVRLPLFVPLLLLAVSAVALLLFRVSSPQIVQSALFRKGIAQFFAFLGLVWLVETLADNDSASLIQMRDSTHPLESACFYGLSFLGALLLEAPLVVWLGMPLWMGGSLPLALLAWGWTLCSGVVCGFLVRRRSGSHAQGP